MTCLNQGLTVPCVQYIDAALIKGLGHCYSMTKHSRKFAKLSSRASAGPSTTSIPELWFF